MKKNALAIACLLLGARFFAQDYGSGLYMEGGFGLNLDKNVGLGFVNTSKGPYLGIGAGAAFDWGYRFKISLGVNIDFLVNPEITLSTVCITAAGLSSAMSLAFRGCYAQYIFAGNCAAPVIFECLRDGCDRCCRQSAHA